MSSTIATDLLPLPQPQTDSIGRHIHYFEETDSTNTRALEARADGHVFVAERQTAGRGRHGKRWHSLPGLGLWFSVSLAGPLCGANFAAALAVRDAVSPVVPLTIRWPNDIYVNERKVGGILVEQRHDWFALGVGVNVNHDRADFPPTLRYRAGSLAMATGQRWERAQLLKTMLEHLDAMTMRLRRGECDSVRAEWVVACDIIGRHIRRGGVSGQVTAMDDDGALLVRTDTGVRRVACGDISIVR